MKNILLLGMSTFPQILAVNRYSDPIERTYIFGYSQLEPTTKFLIDQMKKNGQKLDKIVIMASKDAKEKFYVEKEISYKASACEFYLARISEYIKNPMAQAQRDLQYYNEKTRNMESLFNECEIYLKDIVRKSDGDIEYCNVEGIEVVIVSMQEEKISFLYEVTKQIQDVEKVKLYLDMQGGSRNTIAQMNAIVGLLEGENVEIVGRYAIDFHKDNPVNPIREVSSEYNTYALISAMQAFKKYGRGQSLIEYFEGIDNVRVTELLNAIKKASDSIRLCDINGFDDALEQLSKIKDKKVESAQTEMDIVFEDIVDDYGFDYKGRYHKPVDDIDKDGFTTFHTGVISYTESIYHKNYRYLF